MMNIILCALVQNTVMGPTSPWRADSHVDYKTHCAFLKYFERHATRQFLCIFRKPLWKVSWKMF